MAAKKTSKRDNDSGSNKAGSKLVFEPLTLDRWGDFENLFGEKGACGGCWCMAPRLPRKLFEEGKGRGNKQAMKRIVKSGATPGILGYLDDSPVAWCAIGPREDFPLLERSRTLQPVDDQPVWSIVCLYLNPGIRKRNLSGKVIAGAVEYARSQGATIVEAYPFMPPREKLPDPFVWTGLVPTYKKVGFEIAASRSKNRPVMRLYLK